MIEGPKIKSKSKREQGGIREASSLGKVSQRSLLNSAGIDRLLVLPLTIECFEFESEGPYRAFNWLSCERLLLRSHIHGRAWRGVVWCGRRRLIGRRETRVEYNFARRDWRWFALNILIGDE